MRKWVVYILKCRDDSYYTGITNDLDKRISDHNAGTGAKYTRGRGPVELIYTEPHEGRSSASKREFFIKKLTRRQKEALIQT
ncbi:COG2827: putative endonuclease containing a URI domain [hydrothermal vent metagenome]|uniref:COG2827: putative endonuclease containing a URI domain n=1 Tax=hydrothermal vent metagenome TaxID=652676 RepID=A0A3B1BAV7_9ZZZZ